jgi:hypothetical protein
VNTISAEHYRLEPVSGECPLLAQSGHPNVLGRCPLLGVKQTLIERALMSAHLVLLARELILIGTEPRREDSFREDQTFNTIFFLCVANMQHSNRTFRLSIVTSLNHIVLSGKAERGTAV